MSIRDHAYAAFCVPDAAETSSVESWVTQAFFSVSRELSLGESVHIVGSKSTVTTQRDREVPSIQVFDHRVCQESQRERVRNLIVNPAEEPVSMIEAKQLFTFCALFVRTRPSLPEVVIADGFLQARPDCLDATLQLDNIRG